MRYTLSQSAEEKQYVYGSGPGGQAVNTARNAVRLLHKPTGLQVKVHESRRLADNMDKARALLTARLDAHLNGPNSFEERKRAETAARRRKADAKAAKQRQRRKELKEELGGDDSVSGSSSSSSASEVQTSPTAVDSVAPLRGALSDDERLALSFSGCGFLGIYHFGVVACLSQRSPAVWARVDRFAGSSAGSLVAALAALAPQRMEEVGLAAFYNLADEVSALKFGALTPGFSVIRRLGDLARSVLGDLAWDERRSARIFVSMTAMPARANVLTNKFRDREHLIKHLMASCYIPVYAGMSEPPVTIDGQEYADGGMSDNLPTFADLGTITVSPFSGGALICPRDSASIFDWRMAVSNQIVRVSVANVRRGAQALFPPSRALLHDYYNVGFRDAMRFLALKGWLPFPEGTPV